MLRLRALGKQPGKPPSRPRILLIRPDHLGDVLMASPTVELLRKALPQAHITMMVGPWSAEIARRDPLVDEVRLCPFPGFTRAPKASWLDPYRLLWRTAAECGKADYDATLVLRFDHWWGAWMAALAGIPIRIGYGVDECAPFLTHPLTPPSRVHWVEQGLEEARQLLRLWGLGEKVPETAPRLHFRVTDEDEREAGRLWQRLSFSDQRPVVVLHPGAGASIKLWPEEHWISLGRGLAASGVQLLVTGSLAEADSAERIAGVIVGARSLAGKTDMGVLAALFRRCRAVIGVDSGPLHLAVAVDAPSVRLYGPSDPAVFGPWGDPRKHRVVSASWPGAPCGRLDLPAPDGESPPCMRSIAPERVLQECRRLGLMVGI